MAKRYLLWFAHEHVSFRQAELESLISLFQIKTKFIEKPLDDVLYWIVELESDEVAKNIASRSISLRWCIELWGRAKTTESLHQVMRKSIIENRNEWITTDDGENISYAGPRKLMSPYFPSDKTFKITVETFCRHFKISEKIEKIEEFNYMPFDGSVSLKNPDVDVMLLEYYGLDQNNIPEKPYDVFIGRRIADGQRHLISKLSLKNRQFIGNTSMDAQLSILMANQAQIKNNDIVIDPFVGSGSLLVAAAEFGGYVWGTDIDFLMLHARTRPSRFKQKTREKDESIRGNMKQYNKEHQYLDIIVSDFSMPLWKNSMKFDAIITDPPYGIRESTEKIGIERQNYSLSPEHLLNHIPAKVDYNLPQIYDDLLNFAAKHLSMRKKLVCWYPTYREDYDPKKLPSHPCLRLVANSEQVLSKLMSRRLLTYEKIKELSEETEEIFTNNNEQIENLMDSSEDVSDDTPDFRTKYFLLKEQNRKEREEENKKSGNTPENDSNIQSL